MNTIKVYIEQDANGWGASTVGLEGFGIGTMGDTKQEVLNNIRMLIEDFQQNEGKDSEYWQSIDAWAVGFELADYPKED
ncbi:MAG: hypothetical protein H6551_07600 [Chitinophagales bacterium]|nr:hypothetical protein [Chitinophagaceae bacterium]MCB9064994.1 hypothetical protein [Chitinophagales bacterium]